MAEAVLRATAGDIAEVHSAGSHPAGYVHPLAVEVMAEIGIGLAGHRSKPLEPFLGAGVNTVITVCDNAAETCPRFSDNAVRHHWPFPDPPKSVRPDETVRQAFRRIRDQIRAVFEAYAAGLRDGRARHSANVGE